MLSARTPTACQLQQHSPANVTVPRAAPRPVPQTPCWCGSAPVPAAPSKQASLPDIIKSVRLLVCHPAPVAERNRVSSDGHSTWEVLNKEVLNKRRRECAAVCLSPHSIPCPPTLPPRSSIATSSLPHLPWEAFHHSLLGDPLCSNACSARVHGHAAHWILAVAVLGTQVCSECHFLDQQFRCSGSDKENQTPCM